MKRGAGNGRDPEEAASRAPRAVRDYMERGFAIPERHWAAVEAGIPWSELMDDWDPDLAATYYSYGLAGALDRLADWILLVPGRIRALAGRVLRR